MPRKRKPAKVAPEQGGRPRVVIDWKVFDALCGVRCTLEEISGHFQCSEDTIERAVKREHGQGFADYWRQKATAGAVALRRKQFQVAMSGDKTLLIWLGKQMLGQQDKQAVEHSGPNGGPIEVAVEELRKRLDNRIAGLAKRIVPVAVATRLSEIEASGNGNGNGRHA